MIALPLLPKQQKLSFSCTKVEAVRAALVRRGKDRDLNLIAVDSRAAGL